MAYAINADTIDVVENFLDGAGPGADTLGLLADAGAAGAGSADGIPGGQAMGEAALGFPIGTDGPDTLLGGDGTDAIDGRGGNDLVAGGGGNDVVFGGAGDDSLAGDGGVSPVPFPFPPSGDDLIIGGAGNDTIYGDSFFYNGFEGGTNVIFGGAGHDSIFGGVGADTISGGSGGDAIFGYSQGGPTPGANAALRDRDIADLLLGGAGNDAVDGGGGADTIDGGAGRDRLVGGAGVDALTGGPGADTFVFAFLGPIGLSPDTGQGEGNRDVVTDFRSGTDVLDVTGYGSPSVTWAYDEAGDRTVVTIVDPRTGFGFPDLEIELAGVRNLGAGDILV